MNNKKDCQVGQLATCLGHFLLPASGWPAVEAIAPLRAHTFDTLVTRLACASPLGPCLLCAY